MKTYNDNKNYNNMTTEDKSSQKIFRTIALIVLLIGTIGSLFFLFRTGSSQKSILLIGLFTVWVLSPLLGLLIAYKMSVRWKTSARQLLYLIMIILALVSFIAYSGIFLLSGIKPALIFLFIPFVSWVLILIISLIARRVTKKLK
jgi:hypothetical protein